MKLHTTEADFAKTVIALAQLHGWRVAHFRPARVMRRGVEKYETPIGANGRGFPDLVLAHPHRGLLFVELKTDAGKLTAEQAVWLVDLQNAGAETGVWRPRDWPEIETVLADRAGVNGVAVVYGT